MRGGPLLLSLAAGALAAAGGLLAKLALDQQIVQDQLEHLHLHPHLLLLFRALLFLLTLLTNLCMVAVYSRALATSPTSAEASLVCTSSNLGLTGLASLLLLGEPVSLPWALGAALTVAGSYLVATEAAKQEVKEE